MRRWLVLLLFAAPALLHGQAGEKLTFEVASVKPNSATNAPVGFRLLPSGLLVATNIPVRVMIGEAWGSDAIQTSSQIVGGPSWIDTDHYDINAKASTGFDDRNGLQNKQRVDAMFRALLADRFQVKVHLEMRDTPIYALVLANKEPRFGPRFKPFAAKCYTREDPPPRNAPPDPARQCGIRGGNGNVTYVSITMQDIARSFATDPAVDRPVVDRTGLTGRYDLHLEFVPFIDVPNRDGSQPGNANPDSGPNLFTALIEQAGLKLQAERGQVQFVVIDHVERPTTD